MRMKLFLSTILLSAWLIFVLPSLIQTNIQSDYSETVQISTVSGVNSTQAKFDNYHKNFSHSAVLNGFSIEDSPVVIQGTRKVLDLSHSKITREDDIEPICGSMSCTPS